MTAKKNMKEQNFEESLERLEKIVEDLENGELSLNKSLELFKEGVELTKVCTSKLNVAQQEVQKVVEDSEGVFTLESFEGEED